MYVRTYPYHPMIRSKQDYIVAQQVIIHGDKKLKLIIQRIVFALEKLKLTNCWKEQEQCFLTISHPPSISNPRAS